MFIVVIPKWLHQLHQRHRINLPIIQVIGGEEGSLPVHLPTPDELEEDGSYISAYDLVRRSIVVDIIMANDFEDLKLYARAVLRKTGVKLPRYCASMALFYYAMSWCYEIFEKINFMAGLHVSNQKLDIEFVVAAKELVKGKIEQMQKNSRDQPILMIPKSVAVAAIKLYDFTKRSSMEFFSCDGIEQFSTERFVKNAVVKEAAQQLVKNKYVLIFFLIDRNFCKRGNIRKLCFLF